LAIDARLTYLENEILQADPIRLVQLLYRAALAALGKARIHVREGKIVERSHQISKAGDIVNELTLSINRSQGGEIAATLVELYSYMQTRLQDANFRQVQEPPPSGRTTRRSRNTSHDSPRSLGTMHRHSAATAISGRRPAFLRASSSPRILTTVAPSKPKKPERASQ
jgi:flagellar biosynthetic protein FliS